MPDLLEKTGKIVFLRAHDLGTAYGPPNDQLDVEAVFILNAINEGAYGFQLRNDDNLPARQAMFSLLRDAFVQQSHRHRRLSDRTWQNKRHGDPRRTDTPDGSWVARILRFLLMGDHVSKTTSGPAAGVSGLLTDGGAPPPRA